MFRVINPYDAKLQKSVKGLIDNVTQRVMEYRAMGGQLGYGHSGDIEYIFITGVGDIEKTIPKFALPIVLTENVARPIVIMDMRPYSKTKLEVIEDKLEDMMLAKSNYRLGLNTALLFGYSLEGGILLKNEWYKSFSFLATNILTAELGLDPYDRTSLHVAILTYMVDRCDNDRDITSRDIIITNNILLNGLNVDVTDIVDINKDFDRENVGLDILVDNINKSSDDRRLTNITLDIIIANISKLVISRDRASILNCFDYPELFIPILESYVNNTFLKRTKLVEGFKYITRKVDIKEVSKILDTL